MNLEFFQQILTIVATVTLAFSGVLQAARYQMDFFGALVLAFVSAVGGGTLRDLLIGATPVFWAVDPSYIQIIIPTTVLSILALRFYTPPPKLYLVDVADAAGLALFAILGAQKALSYQLIEPVAVIMGVITGIAGGMIRDVLTPTTPFVMRSEMYALAAIIGVVVYTLVRSYIPETAAMITGMLAIFSLRVAAIYWQIQVPIIKFKDKT
ncbi:trimeric intracellular cation channel family protein [uncultured Thiothrix sp.]|uniref:trimeric intracellular cation channel family protein n=1 Tax=uncultured Thiothrix sp. TaxID=223185 RepID=UPI00261842C1|nr:trimeric intracellular cation channel family protein [uncultured Thiothrix sp.]HMT92715.1 trimeric intracellular cation channel family protein [Thiolinea sp.]